MADKQDWQTQYDGIIEMFDIICGIHNDLCRRLMRKAYEQEDREKADELYEGMRGITDCIDELYNELRWYVDNKMYQLQ